MLAPFRSLVNFALPLRCPGCGAMTTSQEFCGHCWQGLDFLDGPGCTRCGVRMDVAGLICAPCMANPPHHDGVRAAVAYGDIARDVVLKFKYGRRAGYARTIANALVHLVPQDRDAMYVPVPLHRWRLWSRGFNQAGLIAKRLSALTGDPLDLTILRRIKSTPPLGGLGGAERAKTVRSAFAVDPARRNTIAGMTVLLVDDVYTSGATANACARVLKKAGAARVIILCWARVMQGAHDDPTR
jgi:ComF family protein